MPKRWFLEGSSFGFQRVPEAEREKKDGCNAKEYKCWDEINATRFKVEGGGF